MYSSIIIFFQFPKHARDAATALYPHTQAASELLRLLCSASLTSRPLPLVVALTGDGFRVARTGRGPENKPL